MGNDTSLLRLEILAALENDLDFIALKKRARRMQIEIVVQDANLPNDYPGNAPKNKIYVPHPENYDSIAMIVKRTEAALAAKALEKGYSEFGYQTSQ